MENDQILTTNTVKLRWTKDTEKLSILSIPRVDIPDISEKVF